MGKTGLTILKNGIGILFILLIKMNFHKLYEKLVHFPIINFEKIHLLLSIVLGSFWS